MTGLQIREAIAADAEPCARIFFDAFESIATRHAFPIEPGSREFTDFQTRSLLAADGITGLVAVRGGEIIGSAFADERGAVVGIGPVTVDPSAQEIPQMHAGQMTGELSRRERALRRLPLPYSLALRLRDAGVAPEVVCEYVGVEEASLEGVYRLAEAKLTAAQQQTPSDQRAPRSEHDRLVAVSDDAVLAVPEDRP